MLPTLPAPSNLPLYVDLDGTLFLGDTLHESVLLLLRRNPLKLFSMLAWLLQGKLAFKRLVANAVLPNAATLPYHADFLEHLRADHARGRTLVLASAADQRIVDAVAQHLGLFSAALGSGDVNLSGANKLAAIQQHNGGQPFAYAGNGRSDLPVWQGSAEALVVNAPGAVQRQALVQHPQAQVFKRHAPGIKTLLKAIRISQWSKNALLFVPMLAGHMSSPQAWLDTALAFVAFGLVASATYLVNDLLDLPVDRLHQHKRARPLASGRLSVSAALELALVLPVLGFVIAATVSWALMGMLLGYIVITVSYSFWLKGKELVDVLTLATLYTWRLVTGALVAHVVLSNWLMAFSMFLFLSLALVKRCAELEELVDSARTITPGRGYRLVDLPTLRGMGMASGFLAVMVLTLYIDSQNGKAQYPHSTWLWGLAPLMLIWTMRIWLKVARRELRGEDPVAFALRDPYTWLTVVAMGAFAFVATRGVA